MTVPQLIASLRTIAEDTVTKKVIFSEQLGGSDMPAFPVDGTNRVFRLKNVPLADAAGSPSYVWLTIRGTGAVQRSQAGFTITDQVNGIITFSVAPNPGTANPTDGVYVDYNYVWFTDAEYTELLNRAAQSTLAGVTDPTVIQEGLIEPMLQYALAGFWKARASRYAEKYESSGGDAGEKVQTVTQAYLSLAKAAEQRGDFLKLDFYKRQGQRELPSSQDMNVNFDPISPIR